MREYEPITLVGVRLEDLYRHDDRGFKDIYELSDYFLDIDLLTAKDIKNQTIIGLELPHTMSISMESVSLISKTAKQFEKITGLQPKIYSCVQYY